MKRYFLFSILTMCFFLNSTAKKKDQKTKAPKEDIKVNREYDENGNLIRFDSLYSYSWSGDTTILKSFSPKDFTNIFGNGFETFSDSSFNRNLFFDDFDQLFSQPYSGTRDSILMKQFGLQDHFKNFHFPNDSTVVNLNDMDDFLKKNSTSKNDSISSKLHHNHFGLQPKTMEEMMQMLQLQMQQMEEYQKKFFRDQAK